MNLKTLTVCLCLLIVNFSLFSTDQPVKIAIIGDTEKYMANIDMLTVKFSEDSNITVLARTTWDKILKEQKMSESDVGDSGIKIGRLLGADGLIVLTEGNIGDEKYIYTKLLAVKEGVILDSIVSPLRKMKDLSLADAVEFRFKPKLLKLRGGNSKTIISVLNLHSPLKTPEMLHVEQELTAVFANLLMSEENVLISERWNMAEVSFEKNLQGEEARGFKTGNLLIDGSVTSKDQNALSVELLIITPDGDKKKITVTGRKEDLKAVAERLVSKCLEVAKVAKKMISWDSVKEAEEYFKEAQWAYNTGLYIKALQAIENAWALGDRRPSVAALRIKCFLGKAYELQIGEGPATQLERNNFDQHLDAGIMAVELLQSQFINKMKDNLRSREFEDVFKKYGLAENVAATLSAMLRDAYEQKFLFTFPEKQFYLLHKLSEVISFMCEYARQNKSSLFSFLLEMEYAPFLSSDVEETQKRYEKLLLHDNVVYGQFHLGLELRRNSYLHPYGLFFLDRSGNYSREKERMLNGQFVERLKKSNNLQLQVDALAISSNLNPKEHDLIERGYKLFKTNQDKFCSAEVILPDEIIKELPWDFRIKFAKCVLENVIKTNKVNLNIQRLPYLLKKSLLQSGASPISDKEAQSLRGLIDKCLRKIPELKRNRSFMTFQKQFPEPKVSNNTVSERSNIDIDRPTWVKRVIQDDKLKGFNFLPLIPRHIPVIYNNSLYEIFAKQDKENKIIQFAVNIIDLNSFKSKVIICNKLKTDDKLGFLRDTVLCAADDYVIFKFISSLYKIDLKKSFCRKLDIPENYYTHLLLKDNILYAFFEPDSNSFNDSGVLKFDLNKDKIKLICSSRRKPPETVLDGVMPYGFSNIGFVGKKYINFGTPTSILYDTEKENLISIEKLADGDLPEIVSCYVIHNNKLFVKFRSACHHSLIAFYEMKKGIGKKMLSKLRKTGVTEVKSTIKHSSEYGEKYYYPELLLGDSSVINDSCFLYSLDANGKFIKTELPRIPYLYAHPINFSDGVLFIDRDYRYKQESYKYIREIAFYKLNSKNNEVVTNKSSSGDSIKAFHSDLPTVNKILMKDLLINVDRKLPDVSKFKNRSSYNLEYQVKYAEKNGLPIEVISAGSGIPFRLIPPLEKGEKILSGFYCSKYEVTQEQWERVMGQLPVSSQENYGRNFPVIVTPDEAKYFMKKLCKIENVPKGTYRFLSPDERELASRAGTETCIYSGDIKDKKAKQDPLLDAIAWYDANSGSMLHPVGEKLPNAFGLYDTLGNAAEWCKDMYNNQPLYKVYGGTWASSLNSVVSLSGHRASIVKTAGFRVARYITPAATPDIKGDNQKILTKLDQIEYDGTVNTYREILAAVRPEAERGNVIALIIAREAVKGIGQKVYGYQLFSRSNERDVNNAIVDSWLEFVKTKAVKGDCFYKSVIADMCYNGFFMPEDEEKAFSILQECIKGKSILAAIQLAALIYDSKPTSKKSINQMMEYLTFAAENGNANAAYNLGVMYDNERSLLSQDYTKALKYYQMAVERGHDVACRNLGIMYLYGKGVSEDRDRATSLFREGLKRGDILCQQWLEEGIFSIY